MDRVKVAAVGAGQMNLKGAWPEYFGREPQPGGEPVMEGTEDGEIAFPSADADMSGFEWEDVTPESYTSDMDRLLELNQHVSVREDQEGPAAPLPVQDTEWT